MTRTVTRGLRASLSIAIVGALILFARKVDWDATWGSILGADLRVLTLAAIVNLASLVLKGIRWWVFLRPVGAPSLGLALRATFAGAGLNNILVANGGEAARVVFVSRATGVPSSKVLATLALERLFEFIGYVVLLAFAASFLELPSAVERFRPIAWLGLLGLVALWMYLIRRPEHIEEIVAPGRGWWKSTRQYGERFLKTMGGISTGPRFSIALILSIGSWALQLWTYALTARAAGFDLTQVGTVTAILAVNLGFALRATPGGVGVFQALYATTAVAFGMSKDQAIAVALLIQTQQILPVTLIGIALAPEFIFKRRRPLGVDRALDSGV
ncbi:MAG TPA: lysylphosphatidylglycerol synthase transmembrane domain-containing protein [Gemmatimonadaceae bacterium]|nr:lysylphosphatidylglycerol synthase transmembrane domain-containing protein [Gemmatimonadaceae bacterium]